MEGNHYDIIVIGGGPSGSAAARRAALTGARVLLLEKHRMPRPKLCGGWVSAAALAALELEVPAQIIEAPFRVIELHHGQRRRRLESPGAFGVFVDRAQFDAHLLACAQEAGACVRWECATAIDVDGATISVRTQSGTYSADGVVVCSGTADALPRKAAGPDPLSWSAMCIETRIATQFAHRLEISPGTARLHFGLVPFGYGWVLHHAGYLLVGIGSRRSDECDLRALFGAFARDIELGEQSHDLQGHVIPIGGHRRTLGSGRVLLAGDAAGFVDALTGEGIAGAIRSGQWAAEALMVSRTGDAVADYGRRARRFLTDLRMSLRVARVFYRTPGLFGGLFRGGPHGGPLWQARMRGEIGYPALMARMIWERVRHPRTPAPRPTAAVDRAQNGE